MNSHYGSCNDLNLPNCTHPLFVSRYCALMKAQFSKELNLAIFEHLNTFEP